MAWLGKNKGGSGGADTVARNQAQTTADKIAEIFKNPGDSVPANAEVFVKLVSGVVINYKNPTTGALVIPTAGTDAAIKAAGFTGLGGSVSNTDILKILNSGRTAWAATAQVDFTVAEPALIAGNLGKIYWSTKTGAGSTSTALTFDTGDLYEMFDNAGTISWAEYKPQEGFTLTHAGKNYIYTAGAWTLQPTDKHEHPFLCDVTPRSSATVIYRVVAGSQDLWVNAKANPDTTLAFTDPAWSTNWKKAIPAQTGVTYVAVVDNDTLVAKQYSVAEPATSVVVHLTAPPVTANSWYSVINVGKGIVDIGGIQIIAEGALEFTANTAGTAWVLTSREGTVTPSSENTRKTFTQTAHGFKVGQAVYHDGTKFALAESTTEAKSEVVGIVSAVNSADSFDLCSEGYITGIVQAGLSAGVVFLNSTPGNLTTTAPTTGFLKAVMILDSATSGWVLHRPGFDLSANAAAENPSGLMVQPFGATFATLPTVPSDASVTIVYHTVLTADDIGTGTALAPQYQKGFYKSGTNAAAGWTFEANFGSAAANTVLDAWLASTDANHATKGQISFSQVKDAILEEYKFYSTGTWDADDAYKSLNQFVAGVSGVSVSGFPGGLNSPQSFISEFYGDSINGEQRLQIFGAPSATRGIWSRQRSSSNWTPWQREAFNNWQYTASPAIQGDVKIVNEGDNIVCNDGDKLELSVANSVMGCMVCPATDWANVPEIKVSAEAATAGWSIVGTQPKAGTGAIHLVPGIFDKTWNIKKPAETSAPTLLTSIRPVATAVDTQAVSEKAIAQALIDYKIAGQFIGSASTFAALPTTSTATGDATNGDWAVLAVDDIGTGTTEAPQYQRGVYLYDGTTYSFIVALDLSGLTLNDAMFQGRTDTNVGSVSGKLAYDRDQAIKGATANFTSTDTDHDIAKPWTAKDLLTSLASRVELNDILGVTLSDKDLGTFTGATIPDDATVKSAFQALEAKLEDLKITGRFIGSSSTFATLPTTSTETGAAINKDWSYKSAAEIGTGTAIAPQYPKGVYLYNGSAYSFAFDFSIDLINLTQVQAEDKASTVFGEVSGQRLSQAIIKNTMVGADGTAAGEAGSVPAPGATDNLKFLRGDKTWTDVNVPWVFADKVDVTVAAGSTRPTNAEILNWANSKTPKIRNSFVYYTGTSVNSDPEQYTWFIDVNGKVAIMRGREIASPRWVNGDVVTSGTFRYHTITAGATTVNMLLLMSNATAQRTTAATFTVAEATAWLCVSQDFVSTYPASTVVPRGFMIRESGTLYMCKSTHLTEASFSASELGNWDSVSNLGIDFIANTGFTMATPGYPTRAELRTRILELFSTVETRNRLFFYNKTDVSTNGETHIWLINNSGDVFTIKEPNFARANTLHDLGNATATALTRVNHNTEAHFEGGAGFSINATSSDDGNIYYLLNTSGADQVNKFTFSNFAGAYLRNGTNESDLATPFTIAKGTKYIATVTVNGGFRYLNVVPLAASSLTQATYSGLQMVGQFTPAANTVYDTLATVTTGIDLTKCDLIEWQFRLTSDLRTISSFVPVIIGGTTPTMEVAHGSGQISSFIANATDAAAGIIKNVDCHGVAFEVVKIRGWANGANGFVVPVGSTVLTPRAITGSVTSVGYDGVELPYKIPLAAGLVLDTVSLNGTATTNFDANTGIVRITPNGAPIAVTHTTKSGATFNGLQRVMFSTTELALTASMQTYTLPATLMEGDLLEVQHQYNGSAAERQSVWVRVQAGSTQRNFPWADATNNIHYWTFPATLDATFQVRQSTAGSTPRILSVKVWRDSANGFCVPVGTTIATRRTLTATGGLNTFKGATSANIFDNFPVPVQLDLNANKQIGTVAPAANVSIINPLTGQILVTATGADLVVTYTEIAAPAAFDFIEVDSTTDQTTGLTAGSSVLFSTPTITGNIPFSNGVFTLSAGKMYTLVGDVAYCNGTELITRWRDITNNVLIGKAGNVQVGGRSTIANASIKPATTITVRLEILYNNGCNTIFGDGGSGYSRGARAVIEQVASDNFIAPSGTLAFTPRSITGAGITGTIGRDNTSITIPITGITAGSEVTSVTATGGATVLIIDSGRGGTAFVEVVPNGNDLVINRTITVWRRTLTATVNGAAANINGAASVNVDATRSVAFWLSLAAGQRLSAAPTVAGGTLLSFDASGYGQILPDNTRDIVVTATSVAVSPVAWLLATANAGVSVTLGTLKFQLTASGNRHFQVASATGAVITALVGTTSQSNAGGAPGGTGNVTLTLAANGAFQSPKNYNFGGQGQVEQFVIEDQTNARKFVILCEVGAGYAGNSYQGWEVV